MKLQELFRQNVTRDIAPVVYFHEQSPAKLAAEVDEYIVTGGYPKDDPRARRVPRGIHDEYVHLLTGIARELGRDTGPDLPACWISGFYGSGKSSFAKLLGLALDGKRLPDGRTLEEALLARDDSPLSHELVEAWRRLKKLVPNPIAVVFDVGGVARDQEQIHSAARRQVQKRLGYCSRSDLVADEELKLEMDGLWPRFEAAALKALGKPWAIAREEFRAEEHFSHAMNELDGDRYRDPLSWLEHRAGLRSPEGSSAEETVEAIDHMLTSRAEDASLFIVVDEVSQYVQSDSSGRMLKLQSFVSELGKRLHGRVWLLATGQQKLEEVADADILGKLKDRFPARLRVHISSANIRDVVHRRLLEKKEQHRPALRNLFRLHRSDLRLYGFRLRDSEELTEEDFIEMYPLLPGHVELLMRITTELRATSRRVQGDDYAVRGLLQLLGGVFREQKLGDEDVGRLVALDDLFEIQHSALDPDVQTTLARAFAHPELHADALAQRAVRAVALLQLYKDEPTTAELVSRCLYRQLGEGDRSLAVKDALERLRSESIVSWSEKEGYRIQSSAGQEWQAERDSIHVTPEARSGAIRGVLEELLADPERPRLNGRPFPWAAIFSDGRYANDAKVKDPRDDASVLVDLRFLRTAEERIASGWIARSADPAFEHRIFWVAGDGSAAQAAAKDWGQSDAIVRQKQQRRDSLSDEQRRLLASEEARLHHELYPRFREAVAESFLNGVFYFRGRTYTPRDQGATFAKALETLGTALVSEIFREHTKIVVTPEELKQLLEQNVAGASSKFFADGLGILTMDQGMAGFACTGREPTRLMTAISDEGGVSGQQLLQRFARPPYGWPADVIQACVLGLLRAEKVRIQPEEGKAVSSINDPGARDVFVGTRTLRRADVVPASEGNVSARDRVAICTFFDERLGKKVDRTNDAIADAVFEVFPARRKRLTEVEALFQRLPGRPPLPPALERLAGALEACTRSRFREDVVTAVKRNLDALRDGIEQLGIHASDLTPEVIDAVAELARVGAEELAQLEVIGAAADLATDAATLRAQLATERPWRGARDLEPAVERIRSAYRARRAALLSEQDAAADAARAHVKTRRNFERLGPDDSNAVLRPIAEARIVTTPEAVAPKLAELAALFPARLARAEELANELLDEQLARLDEAQVRKVDLRLRGREVSTRAELEAVLDEIRERIAPQLDEGIRVRIG